MTVSTQELIRRYYEQAGVKKGLLIATQAIQFQVMDMTQAHARGEISTEQVNHTMTFIKFLGDSMETAVNEECKRMHTLENDLADRPL